MGEVKVGDILEGVVTGVQPYGAFIAFDNDYSGLVHISEISEGFVREVEHFVQVGQKIQVLVIEVDDTKHLKLSLKALNKRYKRKEKRDVQRRYKKGIHETPKGFTPLKEALNQWILDELKKMEEKKW